MERYDIIKLIEEKCGIKEKYCSVCKADTTMIKVEYWPDEGESETRYRCMNCLKLFTEELKEV